MDDANCFIHISVDQNLIQACFHGFLHKATLITPLGIDTLAVNLVVFVRVCPIETSIPFLGDEEVWKICLLKLEIDGMCEMRCDIFCSLSTELHDLREI